MNINLDTQFSTTVTGNTETTTTSYQTTAHKSDTGKVSRSSYTTDIADKVMDNEAYRGHGMTVDDIMQQAAGGYPEGLYDSDVFLRFWRRSSENAGGRLPSRKYRCGNLCKYRRQNKGNTGTGRG